MVYRRRRRAFRRPRRGVYRKAGNYNPPGSTFGLELKNHDVTDPTTLNQIDNAGGLSGSLTLVNPGTSNTERIGLRCIGRKITVRMKIKEYDNGIATGATGNFLRLMLVQDRQTNGTMAGISDVLDTTSTNPSASASAAMAFNQLANKSRFRVLKDSHVYCRKHYCATSTTVGIAQDQFLQWDVSFPKGLTLRYSNGSGATAQSNVCCNQLFVLVASSGSSTTWSIGLHSRLRFTG